MAEQEKKVSWAELYFDLVFVFAVTELSTRLHHDHDALGLVRALVAFVPVYWVWVGTAIRTNLMDTSRPGLRLQVFAVSLSGLFMALAVPEAYETRSVLFAGAYWAGRIVLAAPVLRQRLSWTPYSVSVFITGPLLVLGSLLGRDAQLAVWAAAAVVDLSTPSVLRRNLIGMRYDAGHLAERFGAFVLIALGESVVAIGSAATGERSLTLSVGYAVAVAFVLSAGLWWVYFHFAADAVRHAMETAEVQLDITRLVLSYGHLAFIAAITCISVGLKDAVAHPTGALHGSGAGFVCGGTALYLATFGYTRWAMFRLVSKTRLSASAASLLVIPLAWFAPALVSLTVLALGLAVLNLIELKQVEQKGWRALLAGRPPSLPGAPGR